MFALFLWGQSVFTIKWLNFIKQHLALQGLFYHLFVFFPELKHFLTVKGVQSFFV